MFNSQIQDHGPFELIFFNKRAQLFKDMFPERNNFPYSLVLKMYLL